MPGRKNESNNRINNELYYSYANAVYSTLFCCCVESQDLTSPSASVELININHDPLVYIK